MRIVFGQRNFKIREFSPQELGFISDSNIDFNIEVRQNYFHLYWIPFFGTGKMWAIRRNGELYELPLEYHQHIKARRVRVRSPWYTYTLPIIAALGFIIYAGGEKLKDYNRAKQDRIDFAQSVNAFDTRIDKAVINQFYILENVKENNEDSKMYLKTEKVSADKISFSIIPGFFLKSSELKLEDCYTQNKSQLDTISISKSELKNAFARDFDVSQSSTFKGSNLLKSSALYRVVSIEDGFRTDINASIIAKDYETVQIEMSCIGPEFTILSIKNIENTVPWDIKLPLKIPAGTESNPANFVLSSKKQENFSFYGNNHFKANVKILDSFNTEHTYLLAVNSNYCWMERSN